MAGVLVRFRDTGRSGGTQRSEPSPWLGSTVFTDVHVWCVVSGADGARNNLTWMDGVCGTVLCWTETKRTTLSV